MKQIPNYPDYYITEDGDVFSKKQSAWHKKERPMRKLKPRSAGAGYSAVTLVSPEGIKKQMYVHRLVAQVFLDNENNLPDVHHKDENKTNNKVCNLEWVSHQYNSECSVSRLWEIKNDITGEVIITKNLQKWGRDNNIDPRRLHAKTGAGKNYSVRKIDVQN